MFTSLKYKEVNWQKLAIAIGALLIFALFFIPLQARASGTYTYRSTVLGTNINNYGSYVYEIVNEKNNFYSGEEVYSLTRIFNINDANSFQYRTELLKSGRLVKNWHSQTFYPNRAWWAENYVWNNYGRLADGDYELRVYIRVDNGPDRQIDIKSFTAGARYGGEIPFYQPSSYPSDYICPNSSASCNDYNYYQSSYYGINYRYSWTHTGPYILNTYSWHYSVPNPRSNFAGNENISVLTRISDIRGIDHFRVKHELYLNKDRLYRRVEGPVYYPRGTSWSENYTRADFGSVPAGQHRIKIYISINGGAYRALGTKLINVRDNRYRYSRYDSYRNFDREASYRYNWTNVDNTINYAAQYDYRAPSSGREFYTDESIKLMTRISDLRYIDRYKIKFNMFRDDSTSVYKERTSNERKPNYNYDEYDYASVDFGKISKGSYRVKIYISVDGKSYKYLDTVNFTVRERYNYRNDNVRYGRQQYTNVSNNSTNNNSNYYYDNNLGFFRPNRKRSR